MSESMAGAPAIVLFSGGLDSTTCLAIARSEGFTPIALSFRYGQRHTVELECASALAGAAGVEHIVSDIDLAAFGGSALVDPSIAVPKDGESHGSSAVPVTYVPARNTIFLSIAMAVAEVRGSDDIFIGVNAVDYSGYPDCRPEFIHAFSNMAALATRRGVEGSPLRIRTPLIALTKAAIIERGLSLGVDYSLTSTCYDPGTDGGACRSCEACVLRARGFAEAGVSDPTRYTSG
jgi:7-cyano-7-deazaguanine synthase